MWKKKSLGGCGGGLSALSLLLCCQAEVASPFQASLSSSLKMQAGMGMGMLKGLRPKENLCPASAEELGFFFFQKTAFWGYGDSNWDQNYVESVGQGWHEPKKYICCWGSFRFQTDGPVGSQGLFWPVLSVVSVGMSSQAPLKGILNQLGQWPGKKWRVVGGASFGDDLGWEGELAVMSDATLS